MGSKRHYECIRYGPPDRLILMPYASAVLSSLQRSPKQMYVLNFFTDVI